MIQERAELVQERSELDAERPVTTAELAGRTQPDAPPSDSAPGPVPANSVPASSAPANPSPEATANTERVALFPDKELGDYRRRWQDVQGSFVDDPKNAVRNADELVASLMQRLAQVFADERSGLEHEWDKGDNVSTEDLRVALRRYRSFFDRLLSV